MRHISDLNLPDELRIDSSVRITDGETNDVFRCTGEYRKHPLTAFVKANKHAKLSLNNEADILRKLERTGVPVPEVIWYGGEDNDVLVIKAVPGEMIWEYIDPRRKHFDRDKVLPYLRAYGECLATIHNLDIPWPEQKRPRLYGLLGEEEVSEERFRELVSWLRANADITPGRVFSHGDFNTGSVLFHDDAITGVIDWEFAGTGWREYELAWALRARLDFLNTETERQALLEGYRQRTDFNEEALRWCEVLNYLHFAYWGRESGSKYTEFALGRAEDLAGLI